MVQIPDTVYYSNILLRTLVMRAKTIRYFRPFVFELSPSDTIKSNVVAGIDKNFVLLQLMLCRWFKPSKIYMKPVQIASSNAMLSHVKFIFIVWNIGSTVWWATTSN